MCAQHTDSEFHELTARSYSKLSQSTTKVRLHFLFHGLHDLQTHFNKQTNIGVTTAFCVFSFELFELLVQIKKR